MAGTGDRTGGNTSTNLTRDKQERQYYLAYEDRYRRVYEQGVPFWSAARLLLLSGWYLRVPTTSGWIWLHLPYRRPRNGSKHPSATGATPHA